MDNFNERLKYIRTEVLKYSMKAFADKLNVSQTAISKYEAGSSLPGYEFLENVSKSFDISANWLILNISPIRLSDINRDHIDTVPLMVKQNKKLEEELNNISNRLEEIKAEYVAKSKS